jgi:hypothetical protein
MKDKSDRRKVNIFAKDGVQVWLDAKSRTVEIIESQYIVFMSVEDWFRANDVLYAYLDERGEMP